MAQKVIEPDLHEVLATPSLWATDDLPFLPWGSGIQALESYLKLLLKWNQVLNLSGCKTPLQCMRHIIQDSFYLVPFLAKLPQSGMILDLGAGAGLPGIPLRIFFPGGHYALIERNARRCIFLSNVLASLRLPHTTVHQTRAEDFLQKNITTEARIILARAFLPWQRLLCLVASSMKEKDCLIIMANDPPPLSLPPGWTLLNSVNYRLPHRTRWLWGLSYAQSVC